MWTERRTWTWTEEEDRGRWGPGPWDAEPDKVYWVDESTDLDCLIVRNRQGALCGYAGVTREHPDFRASYDDVEVEVHGGLTYADFCQETDSDAAICHAPAPGRDVCVWWLGFDCLHWRDAAPAARWLERLHPDLSPPTRPDFDLTYRDLDYVRGQVEWLALQLARRGEVAAWPG